MDQMKKTMYLICGEALYDVFITPNTAGTATMLALSAKAGGSPHNVAIALARLGCPVAIATEIAPDTLGRSLEARLRSENVDCRLLRRTARATPLAMVDLDASGLPHYAFYGLDTVLFHPDLEALKPHWKAIHGVHVGSIPIVSRQSSANLLELIKEVPQRVITSFDPNVRLAFEPDVKHWRTAVEAFRQHSNLIKVSEKDLNVLFGSSVDVDSVAKRWLSARSSLVVVTRGARGATLYSNAGGQVEIPANKVIVADTVGAGDSFQAAMLAWLEENHVAAPSELAKLSTDQLRAMGQFASSAAAATCRHRGPEFPYRKALRNHD
jgi:fructokinase